jgi:hypothetical protein
MAAHHVQQGHRAHRHNRAELTTLHRIITVLTAHFGQQ